MKFEGIELKEGKNSEAELLIDVTLLKPFYDAEDMEDKLQELIDSNRDKVYVEAVTDNLIQVRSENFTYDKKGVERITEIYNLITSKGYEDIDVEVGIHADSEEWFKREDGTEYNEDSVSLDDSLKTIMSELTLRQQVKRETKLKNIVNLTIQATWDFMLVILMISSFLGYELAIEEISSTDLMSMDGIENVFIAFMLVFLIVKMIVVVSPYSEYEEVIQIFSQYTVFWLTVLCCAVIFFPDDIVTGLVRSLGITLCINLIARMILPIRNFIMDVKEFFGKDKNAQERSSDVFSMSMAKEVRIHEAGHACMAELVGISVTEICADKDLGYIRHAYVPESNESIEKLVMINYAGLISERIYRKNDGYFSLSSQTDIEKATELMKRYFASHTENALIHQFLFFLPKEQKALMEKCEKFSKQCEQRATELLKENEDKLQCTIELLQDKTHVTQEEWNMFWQSICQVNMQQ